MYAVSPVSHTLARCVRQEQLCKADLALSIACFAVRVSFDKLQNTLCTRQSQLCKAVLLTVTFLDQNMLQRVT